MIYGLSAAQDVKLSAIPREAGEPIALKKTSERLSRHLPAAGMDQAIHEEIARYGASRVKLDTLTVMDPTYVRRAYVRHLPYLGAVRDDSSGALAPVYWARIAIAYEAGSRTVIPLRQRLGSAEAPDFVACPQDDWARR